MKKGIVLFYLWKIYDSHIWGIINYDSRTKRVNKMLSGIVYFKLLIEHMGTKRDKKMEYFY